MIAVSELVIGTLEEELVLRVLRSRRLVRGPMIEEFEAAVAEAAGARHAVAVNNGTSALIAALLVHGTRQDDCPCEGINCHRLEIAYSRFERLLELPGMSESVAIATSYLDGMLTVRIVTEGRS